MTSIGIQFKSEDNSSETRSLQATTDAMKNKDLAEIIKNVEDLDKELADKLTIASNREDDSQMYEAEAIRLCRLAIIMLGKISAAEFVRLNNLDWGYFRHEWNFALDYVKKSKIRYNDATTDLDKRSKSIQTEEVTEAEDLAPPAKRRNLDNGRKKLIGRYHDLKNKIDAAKINLGIQDRKINKFQAKIEKWTSFSAELFGSLDRPERDNMVKIKFENFGLMKEFNQILMIFMESRKRKINDEIVIID